MTAAFPSQKSRDLYAILKGRSHDTGLLQSAENQAFLASRKGRFGAWMNRNGWVQQSLQMVGGVGFLSGGAGFFVGGMALFAGPEALISGPILLEGLATATGAAMTSGGLWSMVRLDKLEEEVAAAQPRDPRTELLDSLSQDLAGMGENVFASCKNSLSFVTQHGTVVAGEDENGDLALILNGRPLRPSYELISSDAPRSITSIDGRSIPVDANVPVEA